ncbi:MAG: DNA polymerase Y family protein, partial [Rubrivivax sp.]|nr:DNA polymerase Y family protein [Rubrivivax sp.]
PALPLAHPLWLLAAPLALTERQALPWFEGRPLQLLCGPERIESGWWDGEPTLRDYFIAQTLSGALVWVYRDRLPPATAPSAAWFLHGRYG